MAVQEWLIGGFTNIGVWVVHASCVCELRGADLWHGQQSKGTVGRTWCCSTAGHSVVPLYHAFFILGNRTNKGSLKRGSPVELLGIQAQRIQKNFCTIGNGSLVKQWVLKKSSFGLIREAFMQSITVIVGSCSDCLIGEDASSMVSLFVLQWKEIENKQLKQTY